MLDLRHVHAVERILTEVIHGVPPALMRRFALRIVEAIDVVDVSGNDKETDDAVTRIFEMVEGIQRRVDGVVTIANVQEVSAERARHWHYGQEWSILEWAGAMCGEAGEVANVAKKMRRQEQGLLGNKPDDTYETLREQLRRECADTFLYLVLVAEHGNFQLERAVRETFNAKSEALGFSEKL